MWFFKGKGKLFLILCEKQCIVLPEWGVLVGSKVQIILGHSSETLVASEGIFVSITCRFSTKVGASVVWFQD
jgi:hypothetical protein